VRPLFSGIRTIIDYSKFDTELLLNDKYLSLRKCITLSYKCVILYVSIIEFIIFFDLMCMVSDISI